MEPYTISKPTTYRRSSWLIGPDNNGNQVVRNPYSESTYPVGRSLSGFKNPARFSQMRAFRDAGTSVQIDIDRVHYPLRGNMYCMFNQIYPFKDPLAVYTRTEQGEILTPYTLDSVSFSLDSEVQNLAKSAINEKILSFVRPFQGGVALGELRETLRSIKHPALALRRAFDTYLELQSSRVRGVKASREAQRRRQRDRVISDTWLEWSFGVKPLVMDVQAAARALAEQNYYRSLRSVVSASASKDMQFAATSVQSATAAGSAAYWRSTTRVQNTRVRIVAGIELQSKGPGFDNRLWGFTLEDFVPTAWELIPWSFAVDYFLNIQEVLQSYQVMTVPRPWTSMSTIRRYRSIVQGWYDPVGTRNNLSTAFRGGGGSPGVVWYDRISLTRTTLVDLWVRPRVKLPERLTQLFNLGALARTHKRTVQSIS